MNYDNLEERTSRKGTKYMVDPTTEEIVSKACTICGEMIALEDFSPSSNSLGGRDNRCKPCNSERKKQANRDMPVTKRKALKAIETAKASKRKAEEEIGEPILDTLLMHQVIIVLSRTECEYCGRSLEYEEGTIDHIIPYTQGGANEYENLACACHACNAGKKDKPVIDFLLNNCETEATTNFLYNMASKRGEGYTELIEHLEELRSFYNRKRVLERLGIDEEAQKASEQLET